MASPLHQFEIHPIVPITVGGVDISFTNSSLFMVIGVVFSLLILWIGMRKPALVPGRLQSLVEMLFGFVLNVMDETVGFKGRRYFPFVFCLFMFILMANLIGMIPYSFTVTSQIIVTFGLAMIAFTVATLIGFILHGFHYFALFVPQGAPVYMLPLIVPIEVLSYLSRPVSLSVRLFANMMAGHTMLKVFAGFTVAMGFLGIAPLLINVMLTAFEILVAVLQAYVFTILTCIYIHDSIHLH